MIKAQSISSAVAYEDVFERKAVQLGVHHEPRGIGE